MTIRPLRHRWHPRRKFGATDRRCFVEGPHGHGDGPVWLNDLFPNRRENDVAVRTN